MLPVWHNAEVAEPNTVERWGVQQSEVVITYAFSQPDEPAALALPRSHRLSSHKQPAEAVSASSLHPLVTPEVDTDSSPDRTRQSCDRATRSAPYSNPHPRRG
jgi:hypothetical protein